MVYNAMKLFMEINPQLFDDCSHEYTEQQNTAAARERERQRRWAAIEEQARRRKAEMMANGGSQSGQSDKPSGPPQRTKITPLPRLEEVDVAEDNSKRLDSLKLQDSSSTAAAAGASRERVRGNSVGSARSR